MNQNPEEIQRLYESADHLAKRISELRDARIDLNGDTQAMATAAIKREVERCRKLLGEIEAEYLPVDKIPPLYVLERPVVVRLWKGGGRVSCYPTDAELEKIKKWDAVKSPRSLVEFIHDIWWTPEFGFNLQKGFITDKIFRKTVKKLSLSTGGWSGNESIIYALQENIFWALYWIKSERGGHYEFYIPKENWEVGKETEG